MISSKTWWPHWFAKKSWLLTGLFTLTLAIKPSAQGQPKQYLIKLRDQPVAAYLIARNGIAKARANLENQDAISYRSQLLAKQAVVKQRLQSLRQASVQAQMDTVFNGIAVTLLDEDMDAVKQFPEVEQVFPSIRYQKMLDAALPLTHVPEGWLQSKIGGEDNAGAGVRIAVIDSGVDINHPMFQDTSLTPPAGFPKFTAASGPMTQCPNGNFSSDQRFTNSKVIVARNYVSLLNNPDPHCDAEDRGGHGTFVAGIAAGRRVQAPLASLVGVAPKAFIGSYKIFGTKGINDDATSPAITKAIDDAVKDGMNIINLSLGSPTGRLPNDDTLAIAVATAVDLGVTVVAAAGNVEAAVGSLGPSTGTITTPGISPKAITVGASTNGRVFANPLTITASVPVPPEIATIAAVPGNGPKLQASLGPAPLASVATLDRIGIACAPLPPGSLSGRIALIQRGCCTFAAKIQNAFEAGAIAVIIYNNQVGGAAITMDVGNATQIPAVMIGNREGLALEQLLATPGSGVNAFLGAQQTRVTIPANQKTNFSAIGPSTDFGIKPDLVAPGMNIYSATQRNDPSGDEYDSSGFRFANGTSFSTALVSGAAALVKQAFPAFTPAQIKSALVNTAARVVTTANGSPAGILAQGNGLLDLAAALNTPAVVSPVSISFGSRSPGSTLSSTTNLNITNAGPIADTFTVTALRGTNSSPVTITASPSSFFLASGTTTTLAINANSPGPVTGTVEGVLVIQGQNSQRTITVPYWGTFLQPTVNSGGVVNAASFASSGVVAGSLVSIFGKDLDAGGTTVSFSGVNVPVLFSSASQINVQVPFELEGDTSARLVVKVNAVSSAPVTVSLVPASPGIFTQDQNGQGPGIILHNSDFSLVTSANPARPGEFLAILATGLGAVSPRTQTGSPAVTSPLSVSTIQNTPSATIAGIAAPVQFSGLAPCSIGLYQVNIEVPAGVPKGDQTLILTSNGQVSNSVKLPVGDPSSLAFRRAPDRQELQSGASLCSALPGLTLSGRTG
ncbi:MAG: S8 family serine peptidase [Acidobacteria bacterium]|nr:S8 family serine peptidase [Acidobacteriota bacterium]